MAILAAAAGAAAAMLLWLGDIGPPSRAQPTAGRSRLVDVPPPVPPSPEEDPIDTSAPECIPATGTAVRVLDAETGRPIPGAEVTVCRPTDWLPISIPDSWRVSARTGPDGSCLIDLAACLDGDVFGVVAAGYLAESLPAGETPVTVRLRRGLRISGLAVDCTGRAVPDLPLVGMHADLPAGVAALPLSPAVAVARATTDSAGRFVLAGLATGRYRIVPESRDWRLVAPRNIMDSLRERLPQAGESDFQLIVERVGMIRLLLRDEYSGAPVSAADITVAVLDTPNVKGELLRFDARWPGESVQADRAWIEGPALVGRVVLKAAADMMIPILIRAKGYEPLRTEVALIDRARERMASEVALRPETAAPTGSLSIRCPRGAMAFERPAACFCSYRSADTGASAILRGRPQAADTWLFHGIPTGNVEVAVWDGISKSDAMRVEVRPGETTSIEIALPLPTGAIVRLWGPGRRRVFDAAVLVFKDEAGVSSANYSSATTCVLGPSGSPADLLVPLRPGQHTFGVIRSGYEGAGGSVLIEEGRVRQVDVVLEPRVP